MKVKGDGMSVLLVYPPVNRLYDLRSNYFPLGLGYLAAIANQAGIPNKYLSYMRRLYAENDENTVRFGIAVAGRIKKRLVMFLTNRP